MNNICRLCTIQEGQRKVTDNQMFLEALLKLYSIEIQEPNIKVCADCWDKTVRFDIHIKAVSRKQKIHAELVAMHLMVGSVCKKLCRFCAVAEGAIDIALLPSLTSFIADVYGITIDPNGETYWKYLCQTCYESVTAFYGTKNSVLNGMEFFEQIRLTQQINSNGFVSVYGEIPNAPRRRESNASTVYDYTNPLEGFKSEPASLGSARPLRYERSIKKGPNDR